MPLRSGSFREDWDDLLTRFVHRRNYDVSREEILQQAQAESLHAHLWERTDPHQALFERSQIERRARERERSR